MTAIDAEGSSAPAATTSSRATGPKTRRHLRAILGDRDVAARLAASGLETVRARHTCAHRVDELRAVREDLS